MRPSRPSLLQEAAAHSRPSCRAVLLACLLLAAGTASADQGRGWAGSRLAVTGGAKAPVMYAVCGSDIIRLDGGSWSLAHTDTSASGYLYDIWGASDVAMFVAGNAGNILHYYPQQSSYPEYTGLGWYTEPLGTNLMGVWGLAQDEAFAVGVGGCVYRYNGYSWVLQDTPTTLALNDVWGTASDDIFAVGQYVILHRDESGWINQYNELNIVWNGVWGSAGDDVYAVASGGGIYHYDGASWALMTDTATSQTLNAVWGTGPDDIFAVGNNQTILHYDGQSWLPQLTQARANLLCVCGTGPDDVYAGGSDGTIIHFDGSQWTEMSYTSSSNVLGIWCGVNHPGDVHFWDGFGAGGPSSGAPYALQSYGDSLVCGGDFQDCGGVWMDHNAVWDGTAWHLLDHLRGASVYALKVYEGRLIAGGGFTGAGPSGSIPANRVTAWNGTAWEQLGDGLGNPEQWEDVVYALTVWEGQLIAGGNFRISGSTTVNNIAAWDGTSWTPLGADELLSGPVRSLAVYNGELIAGGEFNYPCMRVAAWDGSQWSTLGDGIGDMASGDVIRALMPYAGRLIAAGHFDKSGAQEGLGNIAAWDGSGWHPLGTGLEAGWDGVTCLAVYDGSLIAGGDFSAAGTTPLHNIARWDGTSWSTLGSGVSSGVVYALCVHQGSLYLAGTFLTAGSTGSRYIARWDEELVAPWVATLPAQAAQLGSPYVVSLDIEDNYEVQDASFHYRSGGSGTDYRTLPLHRAGGKSSVYSGTIPADSLSVHGIEYFVVASDGTSESVDPPTGPDTPHFLGVSFANRPWTLAPEARQYVMMGLPFVPAGNMASMLEDDLGPYDRARWRLGRWDPSAMGGAGSYQEYPAVQGFYPGRGYWLIQADPVGIDAGGLSTDTVQPLAIPLEPGWNMIACPFLFPVAWADVVREPAGYVEDRLIGRDPGGYEDRTLLEPWQGYWVYNAGPSLAQLHVPGTPAAKGPLRPAGLVLDGPHAWSLRIDARRADHQDLDNLAGVSSVARDGLDPLDFHEPPSLPGDVGLCFVQTAGGKTYHLSTDVREPFDQGAVWELVLSGPAGPEPVVLSFSGLESVTGGLDVYLVDAEREIDLRARPTVSIALTAAGEHRLTLIVGEPDYVEEIRTELPRPFALAQNVPNPFNPVTTIAYMLPEPARVSLDIYDVAGRLIRRLLQGDFQPAGRHQVIWDGKDATGRAAASGVYFYRLEAGRHAATRRMVMLR